MIPATLRGLAPLHGRRGQAAAFPAGAASVTPPFFGMARAGHARRDGPRGAITGA